MVTQNVYKAAIGLDYFRFTVPAELAAGLCSDELLELLGLDDLPLLVEPRRGGMLGWRCSASIGGGGVLAWGGQGDTATLDLPAGALGYLAALGLDVWGWLLFLDDLGVRPTRVDVAFDDFEGLLTPGRIRAAYDAGGLVTRARDIDGHASWSGRGWTCYVGARSSEVMVRFYDKSAEQKLPESVHWMRSEIELKGKKAARFFQAWRGSCWAASFALGCLRDSVDFRIVDASDSNKSRWALCDWWASFVGSVERCRVLVGAVTRTIENVAGWLHGSVAGALAAFHAVYGADAVRQLLSHGYDIMSGDHERLVLLASAVG